MRNFWYVKHYETVIQELARRGHHVVIASEHQYRRSRSAPPWNAAAAALAAATPNVRLEWMPAPAGRFRYMVKMTVRSAGDYTRFLLPRYRDTPRLGTKARRLTPWVVRRLAAMRPFTSDRGRATLVGWLRRLEEALTIDGSIAAFLDRERPDVVLITPLVTLASEQLDLLRSARARGIHALVAVGSWDHLSSKALIRVLPDRLMVWNATQKEEARVLHDVPAERVAVTGAQSFDHWFTWTPSRSREEFLAHVGLPADRPFVLYTCSALLFGSPLEAPFVVRWARALRAHPGLEAMSVLVRPHPKRSKEWIDTDRADLDVLRLWPAVGVAPMTASTRADYFESLYYASAVVGLNTTAFIEAGIVGRPVLTVILPEYRDNQDGTLHFRYLTDVGGGLLDVAHSMEEHLDQLLRAVGGAAKPRVLFLEAFVRPRGLSVPATTVFVDEVEASVRAPVLPRPARSPGAALAKACLWLCVVPSLYLFVWIPPRVRHEFLQGREDLQNWRKERNKAAARIARVEKHRRVKQLAVEAHRRRKRDGGGQSTPSTSR